MTSSFTDIFVAKRRWPKFSVLTIDVSDKIWGVLQTIFRTDVVFNICILKFGPCCKLADETEGAGSSNLGPNATRGNFDSETVGNLLSFLWVWVWPKNWGFLQPTGALRLCHSAILVLVLPQQLCVLKTITFRNCHWFRADARHQSSILFTWAHANHMFK